MRNGRAYVEERFIKGYTFPNGDPLTPGYYDFDENGRMIIKHGPIGDFFYINGIRQNAYQLIEYEGGFYFVYDCNQLVRNGRAYVEERFIKGYTFPNGDPLTPGYYDFDADGKMIINNPQETPELVKNGIVDGFLYINGVRQDAYQLIEFEGNFYYIGDGNKVVTNAKVWLSAKNVIGKTYADGCMIEVGYHYFDETGKMVD